jgi:hypothetical protein
MHADVVRVPSLQHGAMLIEDEPTHRIVWLPEDRIDEEAARTLELALNKEERYFELFVRLVTAQVKPVRPAN